MDFVEKLKTKYSYISDNDLCEIVDKAKMFYYSIKFPCEPEASEETRPINAFIDQLWIISACSEMIERLGFNSAIGYKENGVSWTFDGAEISDRLVGLLKPIIGTL